MAQKSSFILQVHAFGTFGTFMNQVFILFAGKCLEMSSLGMLGMIFDAVDHRDGGSSIPNTIQ